MNEWEPIVDNNKGIIYFKNKINNKIQFDYPKRYNNLNGIFENIFFENWRKEVISENNDYLSENQCLWKNIKNGCTQKIEPNSSTYILEAAINDNFAFFELFIEYGGNINYLDKLKRNCLHYVAINDNYLLANLIIKLGCKINKKDIYGFSPFLYCVKYFSYKTMKLLIKNNCNINEKDNNGNTALHYAVMNQNTKLIVYLLKHGAKLEIKNKNGKYPIDMATDKNYSKITKILARHSFLIEDEKYYKLTKLVNSDKYDKLLIKKYKQLEKEEENNNNKYMNIEKKKINNSENKDKKNKNNLPFLLSNQNDTKNKIQKLNLFQNNKLLKEYNQKNRRINYNEDEINFNNEESSINENEKEIKKGSFKKIDSDYKKDINKKRKVNKIQLSKKNTNKKIISNKDNIYNKSFDFIKYYFSIIYLFFVNTIFPYIKKNTIKFYHYTRKKAKEIYKFSKIYIQNTYLYYNNTPDIENQIEYLNYSGLSSSIDELSFRSLNQTNISLSMDCSHRIRNKLFKNQNIKKEKKIWIKSRKISYFKKNYNYRIPYKLIYNLSDDYPNINIKKVMKIIHTFKKDKKFLKSFIFHFNLNIKKLLIKNKNNIIVVPNNFIKNKKINDFILNEEIEERELNKLFNFDNSNYSTKNNLFSEEKYYLDNNPKNSETKSEIHEIKIKSNNIFNERDSDEEEINYFKNKSIKKGKIKDKNFNNFYIDKYILDIKNENDNFLNRNDILNINNSNESIYSKKINKTIDNINSMLDEINEINKNKNVKNIEIKNPKGIKLNNKKNKIIDINNKDINNKIDKYNILKIKKEKNLSYVDKDEILKKILLDYNSELNEIKFN